MAKRGQAKRGLLMKIQSSGIRVMIPEERCKKSHKIIFLTQDHAERAASDYAYSNAFEADVYQCRHCQGWHLTTHVLG
jgi:hypothetical protein